MNRSPWLVALVVVFLAILVHSLYRMHFPVLTWEECRRLALRPELYPHPRDIWVHWSYKVARRVFGDGYVVHKILASTELLPGVRLRKNDFPYRLEPGISHHVAWISAEANANYSDDQLKSALEGHFSPSTTIIFENPPIKRSIPFYRHLHVFARKITN